MSANDVLLGSFFGVIGIIAVWVSVNALNGTLSLESQREFWKHLKRDWLGPTVAYAKIVSKPEDVNVGEEPPKEGLDCWIVQQENSRLYSSLLIYSRHPISQRDVTNIPGIVDCLNHNPYTIEIRYGLLYTFQEVSEYIENHLSTSHPDWEIAVSKAIITTT